MSANTTTTLEPSTTSVPGRPNVTILETSTIPGTTPVDDPYLGPLRYNWPTYCSVPVAEEADKDGDSVKLAYRLTVSPRGAGRLVSFEDFEVLELNHKYPPAEHQEYLDTEYALPSLAIDRNGIASSIPVADEGSSANSPPDDPPPEIYNLALQRFDEDDMIFWYWRPMVEEWILLGEIFTPAARWTVPLQLDVQHDMDVIVTSVGTTTDTGAAIISHARRVSGEAFFDMLRATPQTETFDRDRLLDQGYDDGSWTMRIEVRTDPRTLVPERVDTLLTVALWHGRDKTTDVEKRKMRFDWNNADCGQSA